MPRIPTPSTTSGSVQSRRHRRDRRALPDECALGARDRRAPEPPPRRDGAEGRGGSGLAVLIGGTTATQADFSAAIAGRLPAFVAIVAVVAVFDFGWGAALLGVGENTQVEVFLPVIMVSVLFGVSMDYQVFLVSRMHEHWSRTRDNRAAVTHGLAETGRVITAAASIMILVFVSFLLNDGIIVKQFGIGLAAAVIVDAFLIRTLLVPALMHLFGAVNWWLPRWLDRLLPNVRIEGDGSRP